MIGVESLIGSFDVKSSQVFFYAQAQSLYNVRNSIIPFPTIKYNVGGGFNANGTFTAPVSGTYFFSFNGVNEKNTSFALVKLRLNGIEQNTWSIAAANSYLWETMTLDSTLNLTKGDRVELFLYTGKLYYDFYNSFNGILLEEDLSL